MTTRQQARRQEHLAQVRLQEERRTHGRQRRRLLGFGVLLVLVAVVAFGLWQARPTTSDTRVP